jgi:tyrosyl-tRNA synthetase
MGKTVAGAVWLNADMRSPYEYWQFWRNTEDADVGRFLKLFTELPLDEVNRLAALQGAEINEAKKVLAGAATTMLHGAKAAEDAAAAAKTTFEEGGLATGLPTVDLPGLNAGVGLLTAFVTAGLVASANEARRQIKAGALRVNDVPVTDEKAVLTAKEMTLEGVIKLSLGKKKHVLVKC